MGVFFVRIRNATAGHPVFFFFSFLSSFVSPFLLFVSTCTIRSVAKNKWFFMKFLVIKIDYSCRLSCRLFL